jgi:hypothetical protein
VAILHSSLYNAVDRRPTVDVQVTPPDGAPVRALGCYTRADYRAAADHCDVRLAGCRAIAEGPHRYRLCLRQGDVAADLVYESRLPGWRAGTGYLFADSATGHFCRWVVPLPQAVVTGVLTVAGTTVPVQGTGYHDHNWGNCVVADVFSHWYWGRFFASDSKAAAIFAHVVSHRPDPVRVSPFLLIADEEMLDQKPAISFEPQDLITEAVTGVSYPNRLDVSAVARSYRATLSLRSGRVAEALNFASPPFRRRWSRQIAEIAFYLLRRRVPFGALVCHLLGKGSYLRVQAEASLSVYASRESRFTGSAIYEIMQFHEPICFSL